MKPYWMSWYHHVGYGPFELHSPWWVSGFRPGDGAAIIVAAVMADDEEAAWAKVAAGIDTPPPSIEPRFIEERGPEWEPWAGRFERDDWMAWDLEAGVSCACGKCRDEEVSDG